MSLKRRAIRQAIVELLKGNTGAGTRVSSNRADVPQWAAALPAIVVYTTADPARVYNASPLELIRSPNVVVEGYLDTATEDVPPDDDLDEFAEQIERLILPRMTALAHLFGFHVTETVYEGCETFTGTLLGDVPLAGVRLTWTLAYTQEVDELQPVDVVPFLRAAVDWDFGTADTPEAEDDIDLD